MPVDVSYEGVLVARGAEVKETPAGLFLALDAPMPVGTLLQLGEAQVRVARVHEGVGPGVIVHAVDQVKLPTVDVVVSAESVPPPSAAAALAVAAATAIPPAVAAPVAVGGADAPLFDDGRATLPGIVIEPRPPVDEAIPVATEGEHSGDTVEESTSGDITRRGRRKSKRPKGA